MKAISLSQADLESGNVLISLPSGATFQIVPTTQLNLLIEALTDKQAPETSAPESGLLTCAQAEAYLGFNHRRIVRLVRIGSLIAYKKGRRYEFSLQQLNNYQESHTTAPQKRPKYLNSKFYEYAAGRSWCFLCVKRASSKAVNRCMIRAYRLRDTGFEPVTPTVSR
jgi:hypothetical protein